MKTPSKKLVTEVIGLVDIPDNISLVSNNVYYNNEKQTLIISYNDGSEPIYINIYEFAHKCKEWAFNNKYVISTQPLITESEWNKFSVRLFHFYDTSKNIGVIDNESNRINADSEIEAVFEACEYILQLESK